MTSSGLAPATNSRHPAGAMPRVSLVPPDTLLALSPSRLRALFAAFGPPASPIDFTSSLSILDAVFARLLPDPLADVLDEIARIATNPIGRDAILEAAWDVGVATDAWDAMPVADLAARLHCASAAADRPSRDILDRVRVRIGRHIAPFPWHELALYDDALTREPERLIAAARAVYGKSFIDARVVVGEDAKVRALVLQRSPAERELALRADGSWHRRTRHVVRIDRVEWDPETLRLGFVLARPLLLTDWVKALALGDRPTLTLKRLHEQGVTWLARVKLPPGVSRVTVVACELDDGARFSARSEDALAAMHARIVHTGGYLWRATLRIELVGVSTPVDVTIELPNKLFIADARFAAPIRAVLAALGITSPGVMPDDLSSLGLLEHGKWRFVEVASEKAVALAIARKVLVRVPSRRPSEARHRRWGSMFVAHALLDGRYYAATDDMSVRAHTVAGDTLARWKVDPDRLAAMLREQMVLDPPKGVGDLPHGVLCVGILAGRGGGRIAFFLSLRVVREDMASTLAKQIRRACKGMHAVVLVGPGRTFGGAIEEVELTVPQQLGVQSMGDVVVAAAGQVGMAKKLDPWRLGSLEKPLVLLSAEGVAYLGRVRLKITQNQFAMLLGLASEPEAWVTSGVLGARISANSAFPDVVVRKAYADLHARIQESASAAGVTFEQAWSESLVRHEKKRGYRLTVGVVVVG